MKKRVLLLLSNGFEEYEAAVFTDVIGWSRSDGDIPVDLDVAALRPEVKGTWNLRVIPEILVDDVDVSNYDALAIPGGFEEAGFYEDAYSEAFLDIIRAFNDQQKLIASICVGALPLGRSGILKGKRATTYHRLGSVRPRQLASFGADVVKEQLVISGNIITSCGPATALEVSFTLLEKLTSKENRAKVAHAMGF